MNDVPLFVLVDDDEDDRLLVKMALKSIGNTLPVVELSDGSQLITFLQRELTREGDRLLCLVIMDVNMPLMRGTEALRLMRQHPLWQQVPVLIMSTSADPLQAEEAIRAGANGYMVKPSNYRDMVDVIKTTFDTWISPLQGNG